jgi:hypothetical protein
MTDLEWEVFRMDYHGKHGVLLPHSDRTYYEAQAEAKNKDVPKVPSKADHPSQS